VLRGCRRAGATLAELLVALTLAAIVLGAATSSLLRQQRTAMSLGRAAAGDAQSRAALGALGVELAALTAGSGDLEPGQASDTALQLRSVAQSGLACADAASAATFVAESDERGNALPGVVPRVGDSLWWFGGTPATWRVRRIIESDSVFAPCPLTSAPAGPARHIVIAGADSIGYGAPLRIARPLRYAFYRSGDGSWQLGVRDWIEAMGRFASPQPIAGPFVMRAGSARTGFRYFDAEGAELGVGGSGITSTRVTRVRITVLVARGGAIAAADTVVQRDSLDVALQGAGAP
jgi:hypothetical protein